MNCTRAIFVGAIVALSSFIASNAEQEDSPKTPDIESQKSLRTQLLGYWAPNQKELIKALMTQSKAGLDAGEISKEEIEQMAKRMAASTAFMFKADGTMAVYAEQEGKEGTFKVLSSRPETNELDADFVASDGELEKVTLVIRNERLQVKPRAGDGDRRMTPEIILEKISAEEFKKRTAKR